VHTALVSVSSTDAGYLNNSACMSQSLTPTPHQLDVDHMSEFFAQHELMRYLLMIDRCQLHQHASPFVISKYQLIALEQWETHQVLLLLLQVSSACAALESADLPGHAEQLQETLLPAAEQVSCSCSVLSFWALYIITKRGGGSGIAKSARPVLYLWMHMGPG
jgi:hypothetical protein